MLPVWSVVFPLDAVVPPLGYGYGGALLSMVIYLVVGVLALTAVVVFLLHWFRKQKNKR